ncbi:MAG: hypothetical protein AB8H80_21930 [Planctomycetota bacterium]
MTMRNNSSRHPRQPRTKSFTLLALLAVPMLAAVPMQGGGGGNGNGGGNGGGTGTETPEDECTGCTATFDITFGPGDMCGSASAGNGWTEITPNNGPKFWIMDDTDSQLKLSGKISGSLKGKEKGGGIEMGGSVTLPLPRNVVFKVTSFETTPEAGDCVEPACETGTNCNVALTMTMTMLAAYKDAPSVEFWGQNDTKRLGGLMPGLTATIKDSEGAACDDDDDFIIQYQGSSWWNDYDLVTGTVTCAPCAKAAQ